MKIENKFLLFLIMSYELRVTWHHCQFWQTRGIQLNIKSTSKNRCRHSLSFFFLFSSVCTLLSALLCFLFSSFLFPFFFFPSPRFLCSQLFLFLFSAFSFFLSTPIWVVICVYGFYFFISLFI